VAHEDDLGDPVRGPSHEAGQWREPTPLGQGSLAIGGAPGAFAVFRGRNPAGVRAVPRLIGVIVGGRGYAIVVGTTRDEFIATVPAFQAIEHSLGLVGASVPDR
jgi:hypothetical protein